MKMLCKTNKWRNTCTSTNTNKVAKDLGYKASIKKLKKNELFTAEEIFLSGTAAEISPIIRVNRKKVANGKVGKITKELMVEYNNIVMNKNKKYSHWLTKVY